MMKRMGLSRKLLSNNENVILHIHEHIKTLIPNFVAGLLVVAVAVIAGIMLPHNWRPASTVAVLVIAPILLIVVLGWPWLQWLTTTYTVTNKRIITRRGIFSKTGHDIPLARISDVAYEHDLIDRVFGCGTLVLQTSASDPLFLRDVPKVEHVHVMLTELLFKDEDEANS